MDACSRCGLAHVASRPCPVGQSLPVTAGMFLPVGATIGGRFRVERVAHHSGMSTVYQAVDTRNAGALVAVKEFDAAGLPPAERAEALTWLAREAGLLSTLHDPRLPTLVAVAADGDRHYVAMPFIGGETLEERVVREGPQSEAVVLSWARELAGLLRFLHSQDPPVVHRDLKPSNVLLRPDGSLTLLDLGVARPLARGTAGTAVGTPGYAPPEQYQGLADERSDLYALGATLHRALTGYDPDVEAPFRHPPVRDLNPDVSPATATLVAHLLQTAPQARPLNASVLLGLLHGAMRVTFAHAYEAVHVMYRQMLGLVGLALVLGAAIYVWSFGVPLIGGAAAFKQSEPLHDVLRILAVFAPGLLTFLPLLEPRLRTLARRHAAARLHCTRAAKLLALCWGIPLLVWLLNLFDQREGDLVAVPGHAQPAAGLALGAALCAVAGLLGLQRDLRRLQVRVVRLRRRYLVFGALFALWPVSTAMQMPAFHGACYSLAAQSETQSQFSTVQALATDRQGDIYILDQYGLRERTQDNTFHLLLDFTEANSPLYSPEDFTMLSVSPDDGKLILGEPDSPRVYQLVHPGVVRQVAQAPGAYAALTAGPGGKLYFAYPARGAIRAIDLTHVDRGAVTLPVPPALPWQPEALTTDAEGNLYVVDAGTRSIAEIASDGRTRMVTNSAPVGFELHGSLSISRDSSETLYMPAGKQVLGIQRNGKVILLPAGDGFSAISAVVGVGSTMYAGVADQAPQALFAGRTARERGNGPTIPVGGTDAAGLHCYFPR